MANSQNLEDLAIKIAYEYEREFHGDWGTVIKVDGFDNEFEYGASRARYINSSHIKLKVKRIVIAIW